MVFIHGGSNQAGSGSEPTLEASSLARATGNVVVTLNYRLGALGFAALPELADEDATGSAGNYGAMDQATSLVKPWVPGLGRSANGALS
jgi:para-nitrobenzyl esterase